MLGVGGYSSGPIVLMAWLRGVPTLLHEQNAQPGLTNRSLARVARAVAVTFEGSLAQFGAKAFVSGNPVRPRFLQAAGEAAGARRVLIFGGSQGAHAINMAMVEAARELARSSAPPAHHAPDRRSRPGAGAGRAISAPGWRLASSPSSRTWTRR